MFVCVLTRQTVVLFATLCFVVFNALFMYFAQSGKHVCSFHACVCSCLQKKVSSIKFKAFSKSGWTVKRDLNVQVFVAAHLFNSLEASLCSYNSFF